jgi:hypothetical protein
MRIGEQGSVAKGVLGISFRQFDASGKNGIKPKAQMITIEVGESIALSSRVRFSQEQRRSI